MASILKAPKHWVERFRLFQNNARRKYGPSGCWPWPKDINKQGYGTFRWFDPLTKKQYSQPVHRASLELRLGRAIEEGKQGRHVCPGVAIPDRRCFNPEHIEEGTQSENERDKAVAKTYTRCK